LLSPATYAAVIAFAPSGRFATTHVATPAVSATVPQPVPLHAIAPSGTPLPGATAATLAVNVTLCPYPDGFWLLASPVTVLAAFTVCPFSSVPVLVTKSVSPLYTAVMLYALPLAPRAASLAVATPPTNATGDPYALPLIANCTVPVGDPAPGDCTLTAAVHVTLCPYTLGLTLLLTLVLVPALFTTWFTDPFPA
jgi:hypothetical protein